MSKINKIILFIGFTQSVKEAINMPDIPITNIAGNSIDNTHPQGGDNSKDVLPVVLGKMILESEEYGPIVVPETRRCEYPGSFIREIFNNICCENLLYCIKVYFISLTFVGFCYIGLTIVFFDT